MKWTLDSDQLRGVKIGLRSKLRAAQFSETFIRRHLEDVIQQALTEYTKACERRDKIVNPGGWIVHAAYLRAIDQLRREQHEMNGVADDIAAKVSDETTPLPDEEALGHIQAEQLHRAISRLSTSQRQALSLYYFEEKTTRDAADALGWSEPTFRRRRDAAIQRLREHLGVGVPEFDIGLAAWLSLATADGRFGSIATSLTGTMESVRSGTIAVLDRTRDLATRLFSSGSGETAIGIASPVGKTTAGVCAAAIAACTATGVIGPGVAGIDFIDRSHDPKPVVEREAAEQPPSTRPPEPSSTANKSTESNTPSHTATKRPSSKDRQPRRTSGRKAKQDQAEQQAAQQFGIESEAPASTPVPSPPAATQVAPAPSQAPSPDQSAQQQFGLP